MSVSPTRRVALEVLLKVEQEAAYSHIALDAAFARRPAMSARDRGLATRIVYGTLAWQRVLDHELDAVLSKPPAVELRVVLRSALFQLRYLDRVPSHAIVHDAVELAKKVGGKRVGGFVNAVLRRLTRENHGPGPKASAALRHSLPDALYATLAGRLPEAEREAWAAAQNAVAPLTLRRNMSRGAMPDDEELLGTASARTPGSFDLERAESLPELVSEHAFEVQDEGSQRIGLLLEPLPERGAIWDACAGQGGKSLHIADRLVARGLRETTLVATDLHGSKIDRLEDAMEAAFGAVSFEARQQDLEVLAGVPAERRFAAVLLDAPCSGLGLVRRHPEVRWRYRAKDVCALAELQRTLLDVAAERVEPGGLLVYAVCANTAAEGPEQVEAFLARNADFETESPAAVEGVSWDGMLTPEGWMELWPHRQGCDGFFAARLRRKGRHRD